MNINEFVKLVASIIGDHPSHRSLTNVQIARLANAASMKLMKKKIGLPEMYQPGMPMPPEATEISRKNKEDLRPFLVEAGIKDKPAIPVDINGFADIPEKLYYCSTLEYWKPLPPPLEGYDVKPIEILTDLQYQDRQGSSIIYPDLDHPICNFQKDYMRFLPSGLGYVHMIYYRYPNNCLYAIKYVDDMPVYDAENSVDLEWNNDNQLSVMVLLLGDLGINLEKGDLLQYAELHKQQGV